MNDVLHKGFGLGEWTIWPMQDRIARPSGSVHIEPKVMNVLVYLAQHVGEVVERHAMVEALWGDDPPTDQIVSRYISSLRHHLGDTAAHPRYIETIPRKGYRLIEPVRPLDAGAIEPQPSGARESHAGATSLWGELMRRRVFRVMAGYCVAAWALMQVVELVFPALNLPEWSVTLVVVLAVLGFPIALTLAWALQVTPQGIVAESGLFDRHASGPTSPARRLDFIIIGGLVVALMALSVKHLIDEGNGPGLAHIAAESVGVLAFENLSDSTEDEYLSDGVSEDIRTRLAQIPSLAVAARTSSLSFKDKDLDIRTIGERLGVAHVLEGTLRRSGNQVRVTAQLIDSRTGFHVWAETYNRDVESIFAIRDDIAKAVVDELKIRLTADTQALAGQRPTEVFEAYDLYLRGQSYRNRPDQVAALDFSIAQFERALQLDPNFALAHAGLCNVYLRKYRINRETAMIDAARAACEEALRLDDTSAEVHQAHGNLLVDTGEYAAAVTSYKTAIELDPSAVDAVSGLARAYAGQDRFDEAEATFLRAVNLRPGNWDAYGQLGTFLYNQGRYGEAAENYRKVTELDPEFAMGFNNLGAAHLMLGDFEQATDAFERSVRLSPASHGYTNLGTLYYYRDDAEKAASMYQKALLFKARDYILWGNLGDVYQNLEGQQQLAEAAYRSALELAEETLGVNPQDPVARVAAAYFHASLGNTAEAETDLALARENGARNVYVYYYASLINIRLGRASQAIADLGRALDMGYPKVLVEPAPEFRALHDNAAFHRLLARNQ